MNTNRQSSARKKSWTQCLRKIAKSTNKKRQLQRRSIKRRCWVRQTLRIIEFSYGFVTHNYRRAEKRRWRSSTAKPKFDALSKGFLPQNRIYMAYVCPCWRPKLWKLQLIYSSLNDQVCKKKTQTLYKVFQTMPHLPSRWTTKEKVGGWEPAYAKQFSFIPDRVTGSLFLFVYNNRFPVALKFDMQGTLLDDIKKRPMEAKSGGVILKTPAHHKEKKNAKKINKREMSAILKDIKKSNQKCRNCNAKH